MKSAREMSYLIFRSPNLPIRTWPWAALEKTLGFPFSLWISVIFSLFFCLFYVGNGGEVITCFKKSGRIRQLRKNEIFFVARKFESENVITWEWKQILNFQFEKGSKVTISIKIDKNRLNRPGLAFDWAANIWQALVTHF